MESGPTVRPKARPGTEDCRASDPVPDTEGRP